MATDMAVRIRYNGLWLGMDSRASSANKEGFRVVWYVVNDKLAYFSASQYVKGFEVRVNKHASGCIRTLLSGLSVYQHS